ncbi:hypothetical protein DFH11DRAFT_1734354 [Phellopilus nigrolimitatus]|nr:hypothetical protein DFH11DRAFT_1734354 [Phellopilus nigrolimitatus]
MSSGRPTAVAMNHLPPPTVTNTFGNKTSNYSSLSATYVLPLPIFYSTLLTLTAFQQAASLGPSLPSWYRLHTAAAAQARHTLTLSRTAFLGGRRAKERRRRRLERRLPPTRSSRSYAPEVLRASPAMREVAQMARMDMYGPGGHLPPIAGLSASPLQATHVLPPALFMGQATGRAGKKRSVEGNAYGVGLLGKEPVRWKMSAGRYVVRGVAVGQHGGDICKLCVGEMRYHGLGSAM